LETIMKRDLRLRGLSDKHHHALVLAHRLSLQDPSTPASADDVRALAMQFDLEIEPHLLLDEEVLLVELRRLGEDAMVDRALADHLFLREQISAARAGDPTAVRAFAKRLVDLVRFEERELLPRCEALLGEDVLEDIARRAPREATPQPSTPSGAIREGFLADHLRLEALVEEVLAAFEANDREGVARLWTALESGLLAHFDAEETHLIPELLSSTSARDARVIIGEHRHLRARLAELGVGIDLHMVRVEMARDFVHELRAHARNEERLLYPWADEHLGENEQRSMLDALLPREHEVAALISAPADPSAAHDPAG
jgi:Hemerythrin HHE cation binding domain